MLRRVEYRAVGGVPAPWKHAGAFVVVDRVLSCGVADPIAVENPIDDPRLHAAPPKAARPRRLMTRWAPTPVSGATSIGFWFSSQGGWRSAERRGGTGCVSACRARGSRM